MKTLVKMIVLLALAGCASPYRTVYTSAEGDHYIEELGQAADYYVDDSILYAGVGFDPWWIAAYPNPIHIYYDPYYYLYYLSVWYPRAYQPHNDYFGRYYDPFWCPPYRMRRPASPTDENSVVDNNPVTSGLPVGVGVIDWRDIWKTRDLKGRKNVYTDGGGAKYRGSDHTRSVGSAKKMPPPSRIMPRRDHFGAAAGSVTPMTPVVGGIRNTFQPGSAGLSSGSARTTSAAAPVSSGPRISGASPLKSKP